MKKLITKIVEKDGKKYAVNEWIEVNEKPFWGDNYRNTHPLNPTEKAPSFKSERS